MSKDIDPIVITADAIIKIEAGGNYAIIISSQVPIDFIKDICTKFKSATGANLIVFNGTN